MGVPCPRGPPVPSTSGAGSPGSLISFGAERWRPPQPPDAVPALIFAARGHPCVASVLRVSGSGELKTPSSQPHLTSYQCKPVVGCRVPQSGMKLVGARTGLNVGPGEGHPRPGVCSGPAVQTKCPEKSLMV